MSSIELTPNQVEYLAWRVMARLLRDVADGVAIADLHPGDGQYDCLSLMTPEPEIVVMLNRKGTSAASGEELVSGIWERAALGTEEETALYILSELAIPVDEGSAKRNQSLIETCDRIAHWIRSGSKGQGQAICCWTDTNYGAGPALGLLSQVNIPESWKNFDPPYRGSDWSANIYALTFADEKLGHKVVGLINMKTGDAIYSDGSEWADWRSRRSALSRIISTDKAAKHRGKIMELISIPVPPEAQKAFRKINQFNGYEVFGEDLEKIAMSVTKQWYEEETLPADLNLIKGTLFLFSRKSHFIDGFPSEEDLPFLRALANAIDAEEKKPN
jgi:hypothetical protein